MKLKKYFSLPLLCIVLCLALVLGGCALTVSQVKKNPNAQVLSALKNTYESIMQNALPFNAPNGLDKTGELSFTITGSESEESASVGVLWKAEDKLANISLKIKSETEETDIKAYIDESNIALQSDSIFGEGVYGVNVKTLKEDLKDSALLSTLGISYDELMEEIGDMLDNMQKNSAELMQNYNQLANDLKGVFEKVETEVTEENITTGGEDVKAICVNYKLTKETASEVLNVIKDFADKNASLDSDTVQELIDELEGESDQSADLKFAINPDEKVIMQISLKSDGGEEVLIDLGKKPAESAQYKINIKGEEEISLLLDRADKDGKYCRKLTVDEDGVSSSIEFVYDKSTSEFTLTEESEESGTDTVSGKIESSENMLKVTFSLEGMDFEASLKSEASPEAMPEYKNIVKLSEDELNEFLLPLLGMFGGMTDEDYYGDDVYYDDDYYSYFTEFDDTVDYDGDGDAGDDEDYALFQYFSQAMSVQDSEYFGYEEIA